MTTGAVAPVLKASLSSLVATLVDAIVYQVMLFVWDGHYGIAAAVAAVAGAVTNFSLNRQWTFAASEQGVFAQALRYTIASVATFLCLRGLLWLFIENLGVGTRVAWLPAKVLAFLAFSFPLQRWWVFKRRLA